MSLQRKTQLTRRPMKRSVPKRSWEGGCCIPLTQGKFALIDAEDREWLSSYRWRFQASMGYARTTLGRRPNRRTVGMHRFILGLEGEPRTVQVDHINGDKLDNRRCNLRKCTPEQNAANWGWHAGDWEGRLPSGFRGVLRSTGRSKKPWRACIGIEGRSVSLGTFWTEEDAARAYDDAALKQWGEFARLNLANANRRLSGRDA